MEVGGVMCVAKRGSGRHVHEDEEVAEHVDEEAKQHDRVPPELDCFTTKYAESSASYNYKGYMPLLW